MSRPWPWEGDFDAWFGGTAGGFPFGQRFRGRGRARFERGDIRYLILSLLRERPMHGYEVIRELERRLGGEYSPSPGTVYPTLQLLEDMGCVTSSEQDGKRTYTITEAGKQYLSESQGRVDDIWERMEGRRRREDESEEMGRLRREFLWFASMIPTMLGMGRLTPEQATRLRELLARTRREAEEILSGAP